MPVENDNLVARFAICAGAGLSIKESAARLGYSSEQSYYNHTAKDPQTFDSLRTFTASVVDAVIEKRVGKMKAAVSREDSIKGMFDRALAISEKALQRAEALGDSITAEEIAAIHKDFTLTFAKFSASEAPKRLEVGGQVEHVHHFLDDTLDRFTLFAEKYTPLGLLPPADVIEADVVS